MIFLKSITVNIDDATYQYLKRYSSETGIGISDLAADCLKNSLSMLDFEKREMQMRQEFEEWREQHGWRQNSRTKIVSRFVC